MFVRYRSADSGKHSRDRCHAAGGYFRVRTYACHRGDRPNAPETCERVRKQRQSVTRVRAKTVEYPPAVCSTAS